MILFHLCVWLTFRDYDTPASFRAIIPYVHEFLIFHHPKDDTMEAKQTTTSLRAVPQYNVCRAFAYPDACHPQTIFQGNYKLNFCLNLWSMDHRALQQQAVGR
ncbi:hypothetical protein PVAP13_4KG401750 [Panicum virgatum]|uniref:Uncharacterized protein n=1 Tax=Panicum virgatum TaxID=38727 RepID=A0A8T0U0G9_PANVG|nr:hypothetical protein PVAP13_4KG401750 [Panicum virgatum]